MARGERVAGGTIQRMTVGQWVIDTEDGAWYCLWQFDSDWEHRNRSSDRFDREKPWGIQTAYDDDPEWPSSWFESRREALSSIGIDEFAPVVP